MKGSGVFSFKRVMDWSTRYMFSGERLSLSLSLSLFLVEFFKKVLYTDRGQYSLSLAQSMGVSILGGTASAIVTIPIDVLVAQIQQAKKVCMPSMSRPITSLYLCVWLTGWPESAHSRNLSPPVQERGTEEPGGLQHQGSFYY